jgi:transcription initiation factor TFIIF subunit beta
LSNVSDGVLRTVYTRTLANPNSPSSEQISLVGKVIQRAEVRPVENEQYMALKRKQFETSQEPTRKAQMISKKTNDYVPKRDHEENKQRQKLKKLIGNRVRSDEDVVVRRIFDAFSKHQYISMSALETITQQPKNYLQQLVKVYCNYNNAVNTLDNEKTKTISFLRDIHMN